MSLYEFRKLHAGFWFDYLEALEAGNREIEFETLSEKRTNENNVDSEVETFMRDPNGMILVPEQEKQITNSFPPQPFAFWGGSHLFGRMQTETAGAK